MKYHYTYRITNIVLNKHYYGTRTSKVLPKLDLGIKYFSSSSDKDFIKDQKENPQDYSYKILYIFSTRKEAISMEIKLHNKFNVGINESFYNRVKQTSTGFDTTDRLRSIEEIIRRKKLKNGLNSSQIGGVKSNETLRNIKIGNKTALDLKIEKTNKTKLETLIDGKNIHQLASEKMVKTKESKSRKFDVYYIDGRVYGRNLMLKELHKISQALSKCTKDNYLGKSNITKSRLNKLNKLDKVGLYSVEII